MYKPMFVLTGIAALMLGSSMMWTAHATSTNTMDAFAFPSAFSPIEKIGCEGAGEKCPYGYTIERHGRKGWSCRAGIKDKDPDTGIGMTAIMGRGAIEITMSGTTSRGDTHASTNRFH